MTDSLPSPIPTGDSPCNRRHWLTGAVAGAAALGGVGLAWRVYQTTKDLQTVDTGFWQLVFAAPDGTSIRMSTLRGRPLLLNFWATWCPPCVLELPLLSRFYQENLSKGWQVLGLAVDQLEPVKRFLMQTPVTFPVALAGQRGVELSRALGDQAGGLPFTVVFGSNGLVVHRKMGELTPNDLSTWANPN